MTIRRFTVEHATGTDVHDVTRLWGTAFDLDGHFQNKDVIRELFPETGMIVLTDHAPTFYHVVDNFNAPGCGTVARVRVETLNP